MHHSAGTHTLPGARRYRRGIRTLALSVAIATLITGTIVGQAANAASKDDYPSWADVQAARQSVAAKQAEISRLDSLLSSLQAQVDAAQAEATKKGAEFQAAQQQHDEAAYRTQTLTAQADAAAAAAATSKREAGQLSARLARTGGGTDLSATLFFNGSKASDLLAQLGLATQVKDQSSGVYAKAVQQQKSAQSMSDQASLAEEATKKLANDAQAALEAAAAASEKASAALGEQQANESRLEAQKSALETNSNVTEESYNAGVQAAIVKAQQEAAAAAARAAAARTSSGGATPASTTSSAISASGWVRPSAGHISSNFGMRVNPVTGILALHAGVDLAPGCNAPIVAAHSGTVIYAGPNGGYGNFVMINNGDGVLTAYGHIVNGGIMVSIGQRVDAGQQIARVGSTGNSTGCHLHFEVRPGGTAIDPVPYMRAHGVELAG